MPATIPDTSHVTCHVTSVVTFCNTDCHITAAGVHLVTGGPRSRWTLLGTPSSTLYCDDMWQGEQAAHFLNLHPFSFTDDRAGGSYFSKSSATIVNSSIAFTLSRSLLLHSAAQCLNWLLLHSLSREIVTLQLGHGGKLGAGARPPSGGVSRLPPVPRLGMVNQLAVEGVEMAMGLAKD